MESVIASCKESAVGGMEHFLKVFSFVPEDKLNWSPSPTAKTPIRIAAHTALYPSTFAKMIRDRRIPGSDELPEFLARINAAEEALTSRAEIEPAFRRTTDEVVAALDGLTPEEASMNLETSLGRSMPMTFLMRLPGIHAFSHTAQIDYLQTCWGDQQVHF